MAAAAISEASGREIHYRGEPDDYRAAQRAVGAPNDRTEAEIAAFAIQIETGDAVPVDTVERLTGRPPKPFTQYAAAAAAAGAWRD